MFILLAIIDIFHFPFLLNLHRKNPVFMLPDHGLSPGIRIQRRQLLQQVCRKQDRISPPVPADGNADAQMLDWVIEEPSLNDRETLMARWSAEEDHGENSDEER